MIETRLPWVDEEALARDRPRLFHYTSVRNLQPIIESGGILASPFDETNDRVEFRALRAPLVKAMASQSLPIIRERIQRGDINISISDDELERITYDDAGIAYDILVSTMPSKPYLSCFSSHDKEHQRSNGILTMWRLYGGAAGIALGFDTAKLVEETYRLQREQGFDLIYLDRVGYGLEDPFVKSRWEDAPKLPLLYANVVIAMLEERDALQVDDTEDLLRFIVLNACAKHPDFEDEREVRLVASETQDEALNGRLLPRRLNGRMLIECLDALDTVMIGPRTNQQALAQRVRRVLDAAGRASVQIVLSMTPYQRTSSRSSATAR